MSYHSYNLGAIEDMGLNPYNITGDPVMALIAQLNRFAGKTVQPGGTCGARNYLPGGALPLTTPINDKSATTANIIVYDSMNCISDERLMNFKAMATINSALTNPVPWVTANLKDVTVRIAQFADSLGLSPAAVGITATDPKVTPKMSPLVLVSLGVVGVGLIFMLSRRK